MISCHPERLEKDLKRWVTRFFARAQNDMEKTLSMTGKDDQHDILEYYQNLNCSNQ